MQSPVVSIVMPTYNRARLLPRAIDSVLSQEFNDVELIIVDDGSTDDTAAVIAEIKKQDPRIRYRKLTTNRGIGFARDAGLQCISGKYVGFADSDDVWLPDKLKTQVDILDEYPQIEFLFGDFWNINHLENLESRAFREMQAGLQLLTTNHIGGELYIVEAGLELGLLRKTFIQLGTVLLRGSLLAKIGSFNVNLSGPEDFEFCWRAAVSGTQFAYVDRPLVQRHKDVSSFTANPLKSWSAVLDALQYCRAACKQMNRVDLIKPIHEAENRAWRNLISYHARMGRRWSALRAYKESMKAGFSLRSFGFLILMLIGAHFFDLVNNARIKFKRLVLAAER